MPDNSITFAHVWYNKKPTLPKGVGFSVAGYLFLRTEMVYYYFLEGLNVSLVVKDVKPVAFATFENLIFNPAKLIQD